MMLGVLALIGAWLFLRPHFPVAVLAIAMGLTVWSIVRWLLQLVPGRRLAAIVILVVAAGIPVVASIAGLLNAAGDTLAWTLSLIAKWPDPGWPLWPF